jgi:sorting nexin-4
MSRSSGSLVLKHPDPKFVEAETFTLKFEEHIKDRLESTHRRVAKRYMDLANDFADLGAAYNAFSLTESPVVATAVEKIGLALDSMHSTTARLSQALDIGVSEPLHEYSQFSDVILSVLKYRSDQQLALEHTIEGLESKQMQLMDLERAETEARRLEQALRRDGYSGVVPTETTTSPSVPTEEVTPISIPPVITPLRSRGLVSTLSNKLNAIMDNNPDMTRRHHLAKTRDMLTILRERKEKQGNDLIQISAAITQDLDRFQKQKIRDLKKILIELAKVHAEYCRRNLAAWQEAKMEIARIPTQPKSP